MDKKIVYKAKVLYFFDSETLNCEVKYLVEITPNLRLKDTQETFKLDTPAYYENGIPIFIILRDFPSSISLSFMEKEKRKELTEKGYSASEIDAKLTSVYTNHIFRKSAIEPKIVLIFALSILLSIVSTVLVCKTIWV